jgi:hypothetical protein
MGKIYVIIPDKIVVASASREYFAFAMELKKHNKNLYDWARYKNGFDYKAFKEPKNMRKDIGSTYQRFISKAQKKLGFKISLTSDFKNSFDATESMRRGSYGLVSKKPIDSNGHELATTPFNKPLWVTPLALAPVLRKHQAEVVIF